MSGTISRACGSTSVGCRKISIDPGQCDADYPARLVPVRGGSLYVKSHTPHPYQLCYCSICRKTAGGGGFAINLMGDAESLEVKGRKAIGVYQRADLRR